MAKCARTWHHFCVDFRNWFDTRWRQPGEGMMRALYRLAIASGLGFGTVQRAYLGARIYNTTAHKLAALTDGEVDAVSLMDQPSLREVREREAAS